MRKIWLFSLALALLVFPAQIHAAPAGISVVPSILRLDLATEKPEAEIIYTNTSTETISISLSATNFTALEDGYKMSFLEKKDNDSYSYGLASWLTFNKGTLILKPGQSETARAFINTDELSPGGHYAAVLARIQREDGAGNISVQGTLSSLVFVRNSSGVFRESALLETLSSNRTWSNFPTLYKIRFHNTGNVEVIPHGVVTVSDMYGKTVAKGILNEGSLFILPETIRQFDIPLKKLAFYMPGKYTMVFQLKYGEKAQTIRREETFYSTGDIPAWGIIFSFILVIYFIFTLRGIIQKRAKK